MLAAVTIVNDDDYREYHLQNHDLNDHDDDNDVDDDVDDDCADDDNDDDDNGFHFDYFQRRQHR
jgi:hypothetical protein